MTEKEFHKLKSLDLIRILLVQNDEENRLRGILDEKTAHLKLLRENNEILKAKLNDRDALLDILKQKLDQRDMEIKKNRAEIDSLYSDRSIDIAEIGSLMDAVPEISKIFSTVQQEAAKYILEIDPTKKETNNLF